MTSETPLLALALRTAATLIEQLETEPEDLTNLARRIQTAEDLTTTAQALIRYANVYAQQPTPTTNNNLTTTTCQIPIGNALE